MFSQGRAFAKPATDKAVAPLASPGNAQTVTTGVDAIQAEQTPVRPPIW